MKTLTKSAALMLACAACTEAPPACDEVTLECQFAHYKYETSRKPPGEWRAYEIAKISGARVFAQAHRDELPNFAYETLMEKIDAVKPEQQPQ